MYARKIIVIALLCYFILGNINYAQADENTLIVKSGVIVFITPDLKYYTISFAEPTGVYATEGCLWENKKDHKVYVMTNGVWVNAEKTVDIAEALDILSNEINKMQEGTTKEAVKKVKEVLDERYKDKKGE